MTDYSVQIEKLSVRYGTHTALEDIHFSLASGSFLSIIGPNGAGKSTLLKVILGLTASAQGSVSIFGQHPSQVEPQMIGYVPQVKSLDRLFPAKAIELVLTGCKRNWPGIRRAAMREKALTALGNVGAEHLAERQVGKLSGGELQRVYLARALVGKPKLLMLDEPSTGVDVAGETDMYHMLESYQQQSGATIVMISHDLNAVCHLCSQVLVINRQQLAFGSPVEALTDEVMRLAYGHVGHPHPMFIKLNGHDHA